MNKDRLYQDFIQLLHIPGISGTRSEVLTAEKVLSLLENMPYFQSHPSQLWRIPVPDDPLGRFDVAAYLELNPQAKKCVILSGHMDVVGVEEYGHLAELAFDPEALRERIVELPLSDEARRDLESGAWIFGRGTADMKLGLALGLELLRHFSEPGSGKIQSDLQESTQSVLQGPLHSEDHGDGKTVAQPTVQPDIQNRTQADLGIDFYQEDKLNPPSDLPADLSCALSDDFQANILFLAVASEETNSEGMRAALPFLRQFFEEKQLQPSAFLLSECFEYREEDPDRETARYIHVGASGKVMPAFFFVGAPAHVKEPFLSLDPNLLAVEVYRRLQLNPAFCQSRDGELTPPPVCLKMQDLKELYSVSTPLFAASYFNLVTVDLDAEALLQELLQLARESFVSALKQLQEQAASYGERFGVKVASSRIVPLVKSWDEACAEAEKTYQLRHPRAADKLDLYLRQKVRGWKEEGLEIQAMGLHLMREIAELQAESRPMILVGFLPPYYPDIRPDPNDPALAELLAAVRKTMDFARQKFATDLRLKKYYMGISDMCYTGLSQSRDVQPLLHNLVGEGLIYDFPAADLQKINVPAIDLGGFGKDFHKASERLEKHYSLDILPELYVHLLEQLLS